MHRKRMDFASWTFWPVWAVLLFWGAVACGNEKGKSVQPACGNGLIEGGEECDGAAMASKTCADFGFALGELACDAFCQLDVSGCHDENPCAQIENPCMQAGETRCENGVLFACQSSGECHAWNAGEPCPTGACADASACAMAAPVRPLWFVHVSDVHFGKYAVAAHYTYFLESVVPVLRPDAVFVTGDLVDDGDVESYWREYASTWESRAAAPPQYLEIAGNHDVKGDGENFWLQHTATGRWDPPLWGVLALPTDQGTVEVVRTNTSSGTINVQNTNGYFSDAQAESLLGMTPVADAVFRVLLAHHPTVGLIPLAIGRDRMREVMAHFGSHIYLCGHLHSANIAWDDRVLLVQAAEFGEDRTFMLVAWDQNQLSVREMGLAGPWVQITSPADAALGGVNPMASAYAPGGQLTVRAIGFSEAPLQLQARLQDGDFVDMTQVSPNVWEHVFTLPSSSGRIPLSVRAQSSEGVSQHDIAIDVL